MSWRSKGLIWAWFVTVGVGAAATAAIGAPPGDDRLEAARRFVDTSDRYLHHSRLTRGMEGYGLTVLAGTKVVKFKAQVVSVMTEFGPHQDVILARLSEQNLEHTGIIAGMSGSPVFFKDPRDGKFKIVGAVAYGWSGNKDPLTGLQPITQMLAAGSYFDRIGKPGKAKKTSASSLGGRGPAGRLARLPVEKFLATVLDPKKRDFSRLCLPDRPPARAASANPRMVPLATPLMVSGSSRRMLGRMAEDLEALGMVPLASGGVNAAVAKAFKGTKLVTGGGIAVALVTGDADFSAVGTVTDVVGDRVIAFGHSFAAEGDTALPIGPAYVHTVVAGLMRSFKLSTPLDILGTLDRDEQTAVSGRIGPKPSMIPMTVTTHHLAEKRKETFRYNICKHRTMSSMYSRYMLMESAWGWHELPEHHTVRYTVTVDYGKLGKYQASNISTGDDVFDVSSDLSRPISAMLSNPYGPRIAPSRIDVTMTVEKGDISANMLELRLKAGTYRPGETVGATLMFRPYRSARKTIDLEFKLPDDLPEGAYTLSVSNAASAMAQRQSEMPQRFAPRTTEQLLEAMNRVVAPPARQLYLRMPLPDGGGLALAHKELPDLPGSRAAILSDARIFETRRFRRSLETTVKTDYILSGSLRVGFRVIREPTETLLRK